MLPKAFLSFPKSQALSLRRDLQTPARSTERRDPLNHRIALSRIGSDHHQSCDKAAVRPADLRVPKMATTVSAAKSKLSRSR